MDQTERIDDDKEHDDGEAPLLDHSEQVIGGFRGAKRWILLEPVAFLLCFGLAIAGIVLSNQLIFQTCVYLGYDRDRCRQMESKTGNGSDDAELELIVQPVVANFNMVSSIVNSVVPALVGLFLGPWSDRFGRKPVIVLPCVGYVMTYVLKAVIFAVSEQAPVSPWFYLVADIPAVLCGGTTVVMAGMYSYVSDVVPNQGRTIRMGMQNSAALTGALLGLMSSSFVLRWTNTGIVFLIALVAIVLSTIYLVLFVEDSIEVRDFADVSGCCWKLREIFRLDSLKAMVDSALKARPNYDRAVLWFSILIGCLTVLGQGGSSIFYLFTRKKFDWSLQDFTLWQSTELVSTIVSNFLGIVILKKVFRLPDISIAFLSILSFIGDSFIKGLATGGWHLYLATATTPFKSTEGAAFMAIITNILAPNEVAKIFSMAMALTAMIQLAAAPLFTLIYNATLSTSPELFNFVASAIFCVNLLLVGVVYVLLRKRNEARRTSRDNTEHEDSDIII
ncbi:proton-coupled folate transporter-like [Uranotaenia lowii]|uniref:proton-coupled folate transporter-like n=1 Tax=Uranotaenia lowii TaxID=190385 RepID=UPI002478BF42|nr:proton-coupled folate transporter-like [Uranotaenia lowii]